MKTIPVLRRSPTAILRAAQSQVRELLVRYDRLGRKEGPKKDNLFHQVRQVLGNLMEVEEAVFYPAVQRIPLDFSGRIVIRSLRDHGEMKALLKELTELSLEHRLLDQKMMMLQQCVLSHFELEESQIFTLSRTLPRETLQQLSGKMEELQERLRMTQRRPTPHRSEQNPLYPTLQDQNGVPEDDRDTPGSFEIQGETNERDPGDFENWGSE